MQRFAFFLFVLFLAVHRSVTAQSTPAAGKAEEARRQPTQTVSLTYIGSNDAASVDNYAYTGGRSATTIGTSYGNFATGLAGRYERSFRWWAGFSATYGETGWNQIYHSTDGP